MRAFVLLSVFAALTAGCVPSTVHTSSGGGAGSIGGMQTQQQSQNRSGETNPGETHGSEGTTDSGGGAGFGSISG